MAAATVFNRNFSSLALVLAFNLAFALTSFTSPAEARGNGTAASYTVDPSSACPNGSAINGGRFLAMVQARAFNNGAACGRQYKISCIGGTNDVKEPCIKGKWVNVTVANLCSGDSCDTFTLSTDAFDVIAKHDAGRVQITYKRLH